MCTPTCSEYDIEVPAPKDAEGREIPLNTGVMYDANGKKVRITSFTYRHDVFCFWDQWKVFSPDIRGEKDGMLPADSLYLTPPDSWKKLEEDLDKCISNDNYCYYFSKSGMCCDCTIDSSSINYKCASLVFNSIKERIRKLRSKG